MSRYLLALLPVAGSACLHADDGPDAFFLRRIEPLIQEKCIACHGKDREKIKSDYDMTTREAFFRGGESGEAAVVAGKPEKSPVYLSVLRTHDDWEPMPPKENDKLTAEQIGWIKEWIAGGAPWPDDAKRKELAKLADKWAAEEGVPMKTSGGLGLAWTNRRYKPESMWAYQPVKKPAVPADSAQSSVRSGQTSDSATVAKTLSTDGLSTEHSAANPIDAFLLAKMSPGTQPAPPADALTFIRRATFDLTGLPPTPEEIAAFEADSLRNPQSAIRNLIERLLASPHYGERMAQHWLDVVRYADSSGFANDYERGNAWRYRDYVVRSFNADKPYDRFVREQLAGDEMTESNADNPVRGGASANKSVASKGDSELLIATGFLRMGPWELTGMEVEKIARQRFLDDVTNSVGETFLAHSLQCARCHDHKFDPVPTRDYYSIQAVFATTQLSERQAPFLPVENVSGFDERKYLESRRSEYLATLEHLDAKLVKNAEAWFREKGVDPAKWNAAIEKARGQKSAGKRRAFDGLFDKARSAMVAQGVPEDQYPPKLHGFTPADYGNERVARKGLERLKWELDRYEPVALAVYNGRTRALKTVFAPIRMPADRMTEGQLEETCVLTGGDPFSSGEKVAPGVLSVLGEVQKKPIPAAIEGRRKAFADWVANAENPLTTRTIVNRIWLWHFGQALAGNPNNFGSTGKRPTHPELLDWLAATFVEQGWSFKAMHRLIMTSEAYRRSSQFSVPSSQSKKDASAKLSTDHRALSTSPASREDAEKSYAVFKPRRLTAEEMRDAMLAATGELNPTIGGIPNRPEINLEAALQPRQVMGTFAAAWIANPRPEQRHRRSIYALKPRGMRDPFMEVFNEPAPDFSCEAREASTVTPQVFSLFNGLSTNARALALANRALKETKSDEAALTRCYQLAFGRTPRADELQTCLAHWRAMEAIQKNANLESAKLPREVKREAVEENTGEKFVFSEKLEAYNEFIPDLQPTDVDARTRALGDVCLVLLNSNEFAYVY